MRSGTRLQPVDDADTFVPGAETKPSRAQAVGTDLLMLGLRALSQRAVVALASLVDFAILASVFALLLMVVERPSMMQLIALAGYAMFALVALWMRRRHE